MWYSLSAIPKLSHSCFLHAPSLVVMQLKSNLCPNDPDLALAFHHYSPKDKFRIQNTSVPKILLLFYRCLFVMKFSSLFFRHIPHRTLSHQAFLTILRHPCCFSLVVRVCWLAVHSVFSLGSIQFTFLRCLFLHFVFTFLKYIVVNIFVRINRTFNCVGICPYQKKF